MFGGEDEREWGERERERESEPQTRGPPGVECGAATSCWELELGSG